MQQESRITREIPSRRSVPVGLLAVIGSFLLFGLGTLAALTKHRRTRTD